MDARRLAGTLWITAGVVCTGLLVVVFIGEHIITDPASLLDNTALPARVLGGAVVGLVIGSLLLNRPGPDAVRWSSLAGVAWFIAFGPLFVSAIAAILAGSESGPGVSSSLIFGLGIAGAVVGFMSRDPGTSWLRR